MFAYLKIYLPVVNIHDFQQSYNANIFVRSKTCFDQPFPSSKNPRNTNVCRSRWVYLNGRMFDGEVDGEVAWTLIGIEGRDDGLAVDDTTG